MNCFCWLYLCNYCVGLGSGWYVLDIWGEVKCGWEWVGDVMILQVFFCYCFFNWQCFVLGGFCCFQFFDVLGFIFVLLFFYGFVVWQCYCLFKFDGVYDFLIIVFVFVVIYKQFSIFLVYGQVYLVLVVFWLIYRVWGLIVFIVLVFIEFCGDIFCIYYFIFGLMKGKGLDFFRDFLVGEMKQLFIKFNFGVRL